MKCAYGPRKADLIEARTEKHNVTQPLPERSRHPIKQNSVSLTHTDINTHSHWVSITARNNKHTVSNTHTHTGRELLPTDLLPSIT